MSLRAFSRDNRRVISGSAVIMRLPMAAQVSPLGCTPRSILSTLYCVEVTPQARVFTCRARLRQACKGALLRDFLLQSCHRQLISQGGIAFFRVAVALVPWFPTHSTKNVKWMGHGSLQQKQKML